MTTPAGEVASLEEQPVPSDVEGEPQHPEQVSEERRHRRLGPVRRTIRELGLAMITAGVIVLLFVAYQLEGTSIAEAHSQASLKKQFNTEVGHVSNADAPTLGATNPSTPTGGAIDHMRIPRIGLDKFVVQGISENDLRKGPGHYPQTVMPGQLGNSAIAGHRTTYGAPFFNLNEMRSGDPIYITDLQGRTFIYKVFGSTIVSPNDVSVLDPTPFAQLTLTTCAPRFEATTRLIVFARLVGRALPAPKPAAVEARAIPASLDNLGTGDSHAWPPAIGYGLLVILLWIGTRILINRTRRWYRLAAYAGGIGVCLVPLWFCFENVILLLPQSI
jgi:sortase A